MSIITPEEGNNVLPFRKATDGGGSAGFWLMDLEIGTVFLCKTKAGKPGLPPMFLAQYEVVMKTGNAVRLFNPLSPQPHLWVDGRLFSNDNELFHVLGQVDEMKEEPNAE